MNPVLPFAQSSQGDDYFVYNQSKRVYRQLATAEPGDLQPRAARCTKQFVMLGSLFLYAIAFKRTIVRAPHAA
jgi:hypothetical protein